MCDIKSYKIIVNSIFYFNMKPNNLLKYICNLQVFLCSIQRRNMSSFAEFLIQKLLSMQ